MSDKPTPERCDDSAVMQIWRECGLPEYFLGNGGTNYRLVEFARRITESKVEILSAALLDVQRSKHWLDAWKIAKEAREKVGL